MEDEEKAYLYRLIDAINYNENLFTINYGTEGQREICIWRVVSLREHK